MNGKELKFNKLELSKTTYTRLISLSRLNSNRFYVLSIIILFFLMMVFSLIKFNYSYFLLGYKLIEKTKNEKITKNSNLTEFNSLNDLNRTTNNKTLRVLQEEVETLYFRYKSYDYYLQNDFCYKSFNYNNFLSHENSILIHFPRITRLGFITFIGKFVGFLICFMYVEVFSRKKTVLLALSILVLCNFLLLELNMIDSSTIKKKPWKKIDDFIDVEKRIINNTTTNSSDSISNLISDDESNLNEENDEEEYYNEEYSRLDSKYLLKNREEIETYNYFYLLFSCYYCLIIDVILFLLNASYVVIARIASLLVVEFSPNPNQKHLTFKILYLLRPFSGVVSIIFIFLSKYNS